MSKFPAPASLTAPSGVHPAAPESYVFGARHEARSGASDPPAPASCPLRETRTNCYPHFTDWEVEAQEGTSMAPKSQSQSLGGGGGQGSHSQAGASRTMPWGLPIPTRPPTLVPFCQSLYLASQKWGDRGGGPVAGSWCPACCGCNKREVTRIRGEIFTHSGGAW